MIYKFNPLLSPLSLHPKNTLFPSSFTGMMRGYVAMLVVSTPYRGRGVGKGLGGSVGRWGWKKHRGR